MGSLLYSIGFSLILTLITWVSFTRMTQELSSITRSIAAVAQERCVFTDQIKNSSRTIYYGLTKESDDGDLEEEEDTAAQIKPRRNRTSKHTTSKLHIPAIFTEKPSPIKETELKIFQNLLDVLYGSLPIFSENTNQTAQIQELFEEVRNTYTTWESKYHFSRPEHLGDVTFSGEGSSKKQFILTMLLKGGNAEFVPGKRCFVPSLTNYISAIKRETCMSVYKAPSPILLAVFQDPLVVEEILAYRTEMHRKLTSKKKDESKEEISPEDLALEFRARFESKIPSGIERQFIDFTVTKGTPIDSIEKPKIQVQKPRQEDS